jgi:putative oxidoreductase
MNISQGSSLHSYLVVVARVLLVLVFVISGYGFLTSISGTTGYFASLGVPLATAAVILVLIVKFVGSFAVATGIHAKSGAWALIGFVIIATLLAHTSEGEMMNALKNLSIIGGLLLVALYGAGPMSLEKHCPCPMCKAKHGGGSTVRSTGASTI